MSDRETIDKILDGNPEVFADLVNRYKDMVFTLALRIVKNAEDAEEISQDAFVKAYKALPGFKGNAKFSTWLFRIVYNTAISKVRKKRKNDLYLEDISELPGCKESGESTAWDQSEEDAKRLLNRLLEKVTMEERSILTLYYLHENSVEDISQITGLSKSNVKVKLFRSRNKLRSLADTMFKKDIIYN
jgi:RNA polymerase sigma-70 factor (ECF subfamily)